MDRGEPATKGIGDRELNDRLPKDRRNHVGSARKGKHRKSERQRSTESEHGNSESPTRHCNRYSPALSTHENFREEFREAFRNYSQREDVDFGNSNSTNKFEDVIIDFISEFDNTDADQKEQLFKLKLKIFEQDVVKDSGSDDKFKNAKTFIRKVDNPMDALLGYMVFTNDAELKEEGVYIPFK